MRDCAHLYETLAEEHLDHLLDDGQQAAVVHPNAPLEHFLHSLHLALLSHDKQVIRGGVRIQQVQRDLTV